MGLQRVQDAAETVIGGGTDAGLLVALVTLEERICGDVAGRAHSEGPSDFLFRPDPSQSVQCLLTRVRLHLLPDALTRCVHVRNPPARPILPVIHPVTFLSFWHYVAPPRELESLKSAGKPI